MLNDPPNLECRIWQKFVDFIKGIIERINSALKGYKATDKEARFLLKDKKRMESFLDTFMNIAQAKATFEENANNLYENSNKSKNNSSKDDTMYSKKGESVNGQENIKGSKQYDDRFGIFSRLYKSMFGQIKNRKSVVQNDSVYNGESSTGRENGGYVYGNSSVIRLDNDSISKLIKLYSSAETEDFNGTYSYITSISPSDYLDLTSFDGKKSLLIDIEKESRPLDYEHFIELTKEYPVMLQVDGDNVIQHEGRHRMVALRDAGYTSVPIIIVDTSNYNNKLKKDSWSLIREHDTNNLDKAVRRSIYDVIPLNRENEDDIKRIYGNTETKFSKKDSLGNSLTNDQINHFKDSKALDNDGNLQNVYHGTVREFYEFDKFYGNPEGNFGSGFYFTNNASDVEENYANENGKDLTNKIQQEAEMLEGSDEYDGMDVDEIVEELKKKYITSEEPITMECYLNITNPCYVGALANERAVNGTKNTYLFEDIPAELGLSEEDYDDYDDYQYELDEQLADYVENIINDIENTVDLYDGIDGIREKIYEAIYDGGWTVETLREELEKLYLEDTEGKLVSSEVLRSIIESLGYDGIIDSTVSRKFKGMNLASDTVHYIVFNSNQAKLTTNEHPTNKPDVRKSKKDSLGNTLTDNQVEYFKNSVVRDENGNLKVVYHGTQNGEFYVFKPSEWTQEVNGVTKIKGYFSESDEYSSAYGDVKPYYLNITNPLNFEDAYVDGFIGTLEQWKEFVERPTKFGVSYLYYI